jgi:RNA-directed DNA polymerase
MTALPAAEKARWAAGAASHERVEWHRIDWEAANKNVRRLQARIVQATREGRWNKVKSLQRLLTHSFSGRALAVRRVTENRGKRTAGVDGETWNTPEKKAAAVRGLRRRGYRPEPLRRAYVPKGNGKMRPLGIPTMRDRAMQALYLLALDPVAETTADPSSYGFRKARSAADAMERCFKLLSKGDRAEWILEGDIRSCFDRISHQWLLANVPMDRVVLRKWLKAGFLEGGHLSPTEAGTPQGGIISPVLANLALDGMEQVLKRHFPRTTRKGKRAKVNLARYADDFIVTGATREVLEEGVRPLLEDFLRERGLELSPEKTVVTHITEGFDFLGQNVRKYDGKLLIRPSKKSVKAFLREVRRRIKGNRGATAGNLIAELNPLMRGWVNYHRHVVSKTTFHTVDHVIINALWAWAARRHRNKPKRWIKDKYFHVHGARRWVFTGTVKDASGNRKVVQLFAADRVPVGRHRIIRAQANPYDPDWEPYFEARRDHAMTRSLAGNWRLLRLWREQDGRCPLCREPITTQTGWHDHHIVWRSQGGGEGLENRALLHPTCHLQVHSRGISLAKPRPLKRAFGKA